MPLGHAGTAPPPAHHWLSPSETERLAALGRPARRQAFVAGRWLARQLLAERLAVPAADLRLALDAQGRSLPHQGLGLSISHSGGWLAAAVGPGDDFGIDIEQARAGRDWAGMAALIGLPDALSEADFYRHWVLCEAWLKAQREPWSLVELRPLRWAPDRLGDGCCLQADGLTLGVVGAGRLAWSPSAAPVDWRDGGRWRAIGLPSQSTPKSK